MPASLGRLFVLPGRVIGVLALVAAGWGTAPGIAAAAPVASASTTNVARQRPQRVRYRLGPGDRLAMSVFKLQGYEASVEVLSDGTINLPRIGTVEVWGLTLEQARQRITTRYEQFLRRPLVYLDLVSSRPVQVTVTGQVVRPGVFTIPSKTERGWPTLVDVVQQAGGVTSLGDLSRIELQRPSTVPGGTARTHTYDYLSVLREGGHAPNPLVYDGDSIRVHRSAGASNPDLIATAASNFAPDTIRVGVIGEVLKPGIQQVPSNAPLSQAILMSGGITRRGSESKVELIRIDGTGQSTVTRMSFDPNALLSSANNPPLRQGDVVVVNRTALAKVTDGLTDAFSPLTPIVNAASIFRILGLPAGLAN